MPTSSHKRALSSGDTPAAKVAKVKGRKKQPEQHIYITMTTTKIAPYGRGTEEDACYHDAYKSQEDAENALRQIANYDDYSHIRWAVGMRRSMLRIYTDEGQADGYDDDDEGVELKVEKVRLIRKGYMKKVELKRPMGVDEDEEGVGQV